MIGMPVNKPRAMPLGRLPRVFVADRYPYWSYHDRREDLRGVFLRIERNKAGRGERFASIKPSPGGADIARWGHGMPLFLTERRWTMDYLTLKLLEAEDPRGLLAAEKWVLTMERGRTEPSSLHRPESSRCVANRSGDGQGREKPAQTPADPWEALNVGDNAWPNGWALFFSKPLRRTRPFPP